MKTALTFVSFLALLMTFAQARELGPVGYGLQCSGTSSTDLKNCLNRESDKIDEANLPNEIIISTEDSGKESLLKMVELITKERTDNYAVNLAVKIPMIEKAIATALIIQYEDEPQLYYYIVDQNGRLEVIFDGLNSVDVSENMAEIFLNDPGVFSLKSDNVSAQFKKWMKYLKGQE